MRNHYSARARRLGLALQHFRRAAGLTLDQAAEEIASTKSTLSRLERGKTISRPAIVRSLLVHYGVTGDELTALVDLAREAAQPGWWCSYADVLRTPHVDRIALEDQASAISSYDPGVVPGLLQASGYIRRVMRDGIAPLDDDEVERRVEARLLRQRRLTAENPPEVCAIMTEVALRHPVGGSAVMSEQLKHLLQVADLPNLTLQVLPISGIAHPGLQSSVYIMEFEDPEDPPIATMETVAGDMVVDKPADVRWCVRVFQRLRSLALAPDRSLDMVAAILQSDYR